jgi:DNA repair protein RecO (recombination protein O)
MRQPRRVALTPAFVLHQRPYRDTSRIVEIFGREVGRQSLVARAVQTSRSPWRGLLRPFQRLLISFVQKSDLGTMQSAEADGELTQLPAARLMSGFYLNELILKLTEKADPHPILFDDYVACLAKLCEAAAQEPVLRIFEKRLLDTLGYGRDYARDAAGDAVDAAAYYHLHAETGLVRVAAGTAEAILGASLLDLAGERFGSPRSVQEAKKAMRIGLDACLEGRELKSRTVVAAMRRKQ